LKPLDVKSIFITNISSSLPDGLLDEVVGLEVNCGRGLVEDEDLGLAKQGSGETNELSLADTEINKI